MIVFSLYKCKSFYEGNKGMSKMKSTEKNFIKRLQSGKEDALEYIVGQYLALIKGIVLQILKPLQQEGLTEECVNDIFLSAWQNARQFTGEKADFKNWLCAIAKFKAIDYYRNEGRKKDIPTEYMEVHSSENDDFARFETIDEMMSLFQRLEDLDQKIFIMKYLLDFNSEEIAGSLEMTKAAVDNRIYRGKKQLQKQKALMNGRYLYEKHI